MKKLCMLLAALAVLCAGAGCRQSAVSEKTSLLNTSTLRITAVLPHNDLGYWTSVAQGALDAAKSLPVHVKISLPSVNYSVPQMTELIKAATAARVDAILVQGVQDEEYIAALEAAVHQGIQVVFVDTDLPDFPAHLYVGTDNYQAGKLMGEKLVLATGGVGTVGVISGAEGYPNLDLRLQGIRDVLASEPQMSVKRVEYNQYDSMTVMEKYELLCDPALGIDTLACIEGTSAMTLGGMLGARAESFGCIIGFDYSKESLAALQNGMVDGLVMQQTHEMGFRSVEECYRYATQGSYTQQTIYTGVTYITAEDLDEEGYYEAP